MASNESSFVSLAEVVVMSHLLQRELHRRCYSSLQRVSLQSASFQFHSFPVWHDFDGGVLTFGKIIWQPHLDRFRYSSAQSVFQWWRMRLFSASVIIDLTTPLLPLKRLTDYFQPAKRKPKCRMPYLLQQYNSHPTVVISCSSFDDRTTEQRSWLFPSKRKLETLHTAAFAGHMCIDMVAAYHCAAGKLYDLPSWVPRSLCTRGTL